jgi:hypothetical protein
MKRATRTTAVLVGVYAGLLGMLHGYLAVNQGHVSTGGILINAIGSPCQPETVYHACFPALTLAPTFLLTGVLALLFGLVMIIWTAGFLQRQGGGVVLMLLSALLLLVGGGFIPFFTGLIAGFAGTRINGNFPRRRRHLPEPILDLLSRLWPWSLVAFFFWLLLQILLGAFANAFLLAFGGAALLIELALLLLAVFSAFAADGQRIEEVE